MIRAASTSRRCSSSSVSDEAATSPNRRISSLDQSRRFTSRAQKSAETSPSVERRYIPRNPATSRSRAAVAMLWTGSVRASAMVTGPGASMSRAERPERSSAPGSRASQVGTPGPPVKARRSSPNNATTVAGTPSVAAATRVTRSSPTRDGAVRFHSPEGRATGVGEAASSSFLRVMPWMTVPPARR